MPHKIELLNIDCLEYMKRCGDKCFDLAIVDPPYGIGHDGQPEIHAKNPKHNRKKHKYRGWDNQRPPEIYFRELERISKNQIIFGANYFVEYLNNPTKGWAIWDKGQRGLTMSDCEIIYTSFDNPTRIITVNRAYIPEKGGSIHPTQKPVRLYKYLLNMFSKPGDRIFDSHMGSGSIAIACIEFGLELVACEIDKTYYELAKKRIDNYTKQLTLGLYIN